MFHDTVVDMDVFHELSGYKGHVLLIQGMLDQTVNYSYAIRAKENYEPGQCHLQLVPDMGHNMTDKQRNSVISSIRQFLLEKTEVLTVRVILTHKKEEKNENYSEKGICFTGFCETEFFKGVVLPGAYHSTKYFADGTEDDCADYVMEGLDCEHKECQIHIMNRSVNGEWKPIIETNSKALAWIEHADATAVLDKSKEGPIVRFYMRK